MSNPAILANDTYTLLEINFCFEVREKYFTVCSKITLRSFIRALFLIMGSLFKMIDRIRLVNIAYCLLFAYTSHSLSRTK